MSPLQDIMSGLVNKTPQSSHDLVAQAETVNPTATIIIPDKNHLTSILSIIQHNPAHTFFLHLTITSISLYSIIQVDSWCHINHF